MDSRREKGFQWKIKCLFRHFIHLFSSSTALIVYYFASKIVGLICALFLAALGWNRKGIQGENSSRAALAELRKGLLEL